MCMTLASRACLPSGCGLPIVALYAIHVSITVLIQIQCAIQISCRLDSAVVYIDTEMKFSERRLSQIMQRQHASTHSPSINLDEHLSTLMQRIHVVRPQTGAAQGVLRLLHEI
jgi:hypothetical protein